MRYSSATCAADAMLAALLQLALVPGPAADMEPLVLLCMREFSSAWSLLVGMPPFSAAPEVAIAAPLPGWLSNFC